MPVEIKELESLVIDGESKGPVTQAIASGNFSSETLTEIQLALEEFRNNLLIKNGEALQTKELECEAKIQELKLENQSAIQQIEGQIEDVQIQNNLQKEIYENSISQLTQERDSLEDLRVTMTQKVISALQSNDPEQVKALGIEFITPEQEKIRQEKIAQLEALKVELGLE